jgi:3-oxoacyl-[acyl-carrier-protein] synthase II
MERRVVVTGIGLITPAGCSPDDFYDALLCGRSGIRRLEDIPDKNGRCRIGAPVVSYSCAALLTERQASRMDRASQMCYSATDRALVDAGLVRSPGLRATEGGIALIVGTAGGAPHAIEKNYFDYFSTRGTSVHAIHSSMPHAACAATSILMGLTGPTLTVSTACSSGAAALGTAFSLVRTGQARVAVAGGADSTLAPIHFDNWACLGVLARADGDPAKAMRPFSGDRTGFALGEGAAMLVLEDLESARRRDVSIYGELLGYGATSDGTHMTSPSVDGQARAMQAALESAGLRREEIDYISAHGTGTRVNDQVETDAMKRVFGRVPPVSSIKPVTGHMLGASGACEVAVCLLALRKGALPPTLNFLGGDPGCDLDYIGEGPRSLDVRTAMSNSFAFGGNNVSVIAGRVRNCYESGRNSQ